MEQSPSWTYHDTGVALIMVAFLCCFCWLSSRATEDADGLPESLLTFAVGRTTFLMAFLGVYCFILDKRG